MDEKEEPSREEMEKGAREAGAVARAALEMAHGLVKPGAKYLDVANALESLIREKGMEPAFPVNLSLNAQAAHYTPSLDDALVFPDSGLVKVDLGAAKGGILSDCAITIDLSGSMQELVTSTDDALAAAISTVKAGVSVSAIGKEIETAISKHGFKPIMNLGGHGVRFHDLHASPFIPNYDNGDDTVLEEGEIIAIEPFATTSEGRGSVANTDIWEIYSLAGEASVRQPDARAVLKEVLAKYPSEPFAARWLAGVVGSRFSLYSALKALVSAGALEPHPTLAEMNGATVSQKEATLLVTKDSCEVLT
ncbi:MAG: type II methionyl aminopeptidase [Candidatus Marsarchaeota archaeon]|jgi:methionyl aminopeptidase|nr:type II methionyl aminopeptidase [Candidatus Marsarchaeota archaeon]